MEVNNQLVKRSEELKLWQPKPSVSLEVAIKSPKLGSLSKVDRETLAEKIVMLLSRLSALVNVDKNLTSFQIATITEALISEHYHLSLEDIQICLDRGAMGKYGQLYNRLDGAIIFDWFSKYELDRLDRMDIMRNEEQAANNIYEIFNIPVMQDIVIDVVQKMQDRVKQEPTKDTVREAPPFDKLIMKEFDSLPAGPNRGLRTVIYNGVELDYTSYRTIRFKESLDSLNNEQENGTN